MVAAEGPSNSPTGLRLTLDLTKATWSDLRYYVNACRDIPDECDLGLELDEYDEYGEHVVIITGLREVLGRAVR